MSPENERAQLGDKMDLVAEPSAVRSTGERQTVVLVADDDAVFRNLLTLLMQRDGYHVLTVADGHEGLELSRSYAGTIDLVITDVQMPRLTGPEFCAHLFAERPGIRALLISDADQVEIGTQSANTAFLPKPFDGQILTARVRAILAGSDNCQH